MTARHLLPLFFVACGFGVQHHLSQIPFESIPGAIHKGALRELVQEGDYLDFIRFRKQVLLATQSPLLDLNNAY